MELELELAMWNTLPLEQLSTWCEYIFAMLLFFYWFQQQNTLLAYQNELVIPLNWISGYQTEKQVPLTDSELNCLRYRHFFKPIKYFLLLAGELVIGTLFLLQNWSINYAIVFASIWALIAIVLPDMLINSIEKNRQQRIAKQMPDLVDLMAICVQSGMTIEASIKYLAIEMQGFDREIALLLDRTNRYARTHGMKSALEALYQQAPSAEMYRFVMALSQVVQHDSSIYVMLISLSSDLRERQMLDLTEQIGKSSMKISIPLIFFIVMPIVLFIAAPQVMR